jgi:hypothetical protein
MGGRTLQKRQIIYLSPIWLDCFAQMGLSILKSREIVVLETHRTKVQIY